MGRSTDLEAQRLTDNFDDSNDLQLLEKEDDSNVSSSSTLLPAPSGSAADQLPTTEASAAANSPSDAAEYTTAAATKWAYLAAYFACNVALTLYNKSILGRFAYPWLLTAIHTGAASIGCGVLMLRGQIRRTSLSRRQETVLLAFSVLFTVNIAVSNVSLAMVSIPFHQIMRSTCPVFTVLIYRLRYGRTYATKTYLSLVPVVLGVALATYGDYYFTLVGFVLTFLGVILATIKVCSFPRFARSPPHFPLVFLASLAILLTYSLLLTLLRLSLPTAS